MNDKFSECNTPFTKCWCEAVPGRQNNPKCKSLVPSVSIESELLTFIIVAGILAFISLFTNAFRDKFKDIEEIETINPKEFKKGDISEYETVTVEFGGGVFGMPIRDEKTFNKLVLEKIQEGFKPYGQVQISIKQGGSFLSHVGITVMTQAMVKYQE